MSLPLPEKSNLIVIGAWNPAILQHPLLRNEFPTLITEDNINIQLVAGAGSVSSYRMEFEKFFLDPNGGRLVFNPTNFELETLKLIADLAQGIREKLQFTPIAAAGCNFACPVRRYFLPEIQQLLNTFGGTAFLSQQRALGPWTPGLT